MLFHMAKVLNTTERESGGTSDPLATRKWSAGMVHAHRRENFLLSSHAAKIPTGVILRA